MQATALRRKVTFQQVLADLGELSNTQLARLMPAMLALRTRRGRHVLPQREAELLEEINRSLPPKTQADYDELTAKRRADTLTAAARKQLLRLVDTVEAHDARRLRCLVELAGLRHTSVEALMDDLGLKPPPYA
jgi:hypothetical protein